MTGTSSLWTSTQLVRTFSSPRHADASLDLQGIAVCAGDVRLIAAPDAPLVGACLSATHRCIMLHVARRVQRGCLPGIRCLRLAHTRLAQREAVATGIRAFESPRHLAGDSNLRGVIHASLSCGRLDAPLPKSGGRPQRRPKIATCTPTRSVLPDRKHLRDARQNKTGARPLGRTF